MSEIKVGDEVIHRSYDTGMMDVCARVEKIDYLNGRALATIRFGMKAIRIYVDELTPAQDALATAQARVAELEAALEDIYAIAAYHDFDRSRRAEIRSIAKKLLDKGKAK